MPPFSNNNQRTTEPHQPAIERNTSEPFGIYPPPAEPFGAHPQTAEPDGSLPNPAEPFGASLQRTEHDGTGPNPAEPVRTFTNPEFSPSATPPGNPQPGEVINPTADRGEQHTVTVRETARQFEAAGVSRTERSITNWCQANRHGTARLDCYYDPNERRYFISQASIDRAIAEEVDRAKRHQPTPPPVEDAAKSNRASEESAAPVDDATRQSLDTKLRDLEIASRVKDQFISHLEKERDQLIDRMESSAHRIGQLETQLLQAGEPAPEFRASD